MKLIYFYKYLNFCKICNRHSLSWNTPMFLSSILFSCNNKDIVCILMGVFVYVNKGIYTNTLVGICCFNSPIQLSVSVVEVDIDFFWILEFPIIIRTVKIRDDTASPPPLRSSIAPQRGRPSSASKINFASLFLLACGG